MKRQGVIKSDFDNRTVDNLSTTHLGNQIAQTLSPMPDDKPVRLVKAYPTPEYKHAPDKEDIERANRVELQYLRDRLRQKNDKIRRLREEIEHTIRLFIAALEGKEETEEQIKRRISGLKGALEYIGRSDYTENER